MTIQPSNTHEPAVGVGDAVPDLRGRPPESPYGDPTRRRPRLATVRDVRPAPSGPVPNNLPVQLSSFVGRDTELAALSDLVRDHRLVTLTGAGGVGKSRLAVQVAAEIVDRPADGVWWVELGPVTDADRVVGAVASVLGFREEQERPLIETLAGQLSNAAMVLFIDNCEHVLDTTGKLVETLLLAAPGVRVVATSRESLGIAGEVAWRVPSLEEASAVELFVERAAQARPKWKADAEQIEVISRICRRLDGLPLAIELAAARTRMMHPARIAAGLDDRFRLLTGGNRTALPRQQTLEASVSWSYELLDEPERTVLRRLSVFTGGFTLEAAEAVCADGEVIEHYAVLDLVSRLVDKSLIAVDDTDSRFRLLETILQFIRARLVDADEIGATRTAHLGYYLDYAEGVEPGLARRDGPLLLAQLDAEWDNLRASMEWAETTGAHELFLRLVTALAVFWVLRGHAAEGGRWFARALAFDGGPSVLRARALWGAAYVAIYADDHETRDLRSAQALVMAREVNDAWALARATNAVSYVSLWQDPAAARAELARSVELARSIGDEFGVADGIKMATIAWQVEDDHEGARPAFEELLRVAQELDNKFYIAWYHNGMALASLRRGEFALAREHCERSLELCRAVGDPSTAGVTIAWLGEVEAVTGQRDEARERYQTFLQRAAATGGDQGFPFAFINLMTLLVGCGQADIAAALTGQVIATGRDQMSRVPMIFAWLLTVHGSALSEIGDEAAFEALSQADHIAATANNPWLTALVKHHLGRLALRRDNPSQAEDLHHQALDLRHAHQLRPGVVESLEALAGLAVGHQSPAEAARLFAAADTSRTVLGLVRWPADQIRYDEDLGCVRQQLDESAFAAAWAEGCALSADEAVAYASRARGQRRRPTTGWSSLTPTETAVVELLAQGLTNPQIAERCFISRATVKTHLIHVFNKLGVTTRSQLAAEAARRAHR